MIILYALTHYIILVYASPPPDERLNCPKSDFWKSKMSKNVIDMGQILKIRQTRRKRLIINNTLKTSIYIFFFIKFTLTVYIVRTFILFMRLINNIGGFEVFILFYWYVLPQLVFGITCAPHLWFPMIKIRRSLVKQTKRHIKQLS